MIRFSPLSRTQRSATIAAVLALHAMVLGLFLLSGRVASVPMPKPPMALVEVSVASPEPPGAPPPPPSIPNERALEAAPPAPPSVALSPTGTSAPAGGCATLASVSAAINADPAAAAEIQNSPVQLRSISGAVVVWNAGWSEGARGPDEPLEGVRGVIEETLRTVDPACLKEEVAGPRLVAVPMGDHSMYAVLGSGRWIWEQMLLPIDSPPVSTVDTNAPLPPAARPSG